MQLNLANEAQQGPPSDQYQQQGYEQYQQYQPNQSYSNNQYANYTDQSNGYQHQQTYDQNYQGQQSYDQSAYEYQDPQHYQSNAQDYAYQNQHQEYTQPLQASDISYHGQSNLPTSHSVGQNLANIAQAEFNSQYIDSEPTGSSSMHDMQTHIPLSSTPVLSHTQPAHVNTRFPSQPISHSSSFINDNQSNSIFGSNSGDPIGSSEQPTRIQQEMKDKVRKNFEAYDLQNSGLNPIITSSVCPSCHNSNPRDNKFCCECGSAMKPPQSLYQAPRQDRTERINKPSQLSQHQQHEYTPHQQEILQKSPMQPVKFIDPLGRSRGHAIGILSLGCIVTLFPKKQSRVNVSDGRPHIASVPGPVTIRPVHAVVHKSINDEITTHGGPLLGGAKGKLKKKDVLALIDVKIVAARDASDSSDQLNRVSCLNDLELFYAVLRLMVDSDGNALYTLNFIADFSKIPGQLLSLFKDARQSTPSDTLQSLQSLLEDGNKADALKLATDTRYWAAAIILAGAMGKDAYKSTIQLFSTQTFGKETQSLQPAVYRSNPVLCIFFALLGGSTQAQLLLDVDSTWKSTLRIILANRMTGDAEVLAMLGDSLKSSGRVLAGHLCQMFAGDVVCSGVNSNAAIVLFGADHKHHSTTFYRDTQAFNLTEIYEYSQTLIGSSGLSNCIPHFLAYKIVYISYLIDLGHFTVASSYIMSVQAFIKNYNKASPYLHQKLLETTKMLAERVAGRTQGRETGKGAASSWLSKVGGFDSFSIMGALDRGINSLMTNAVGLDSEVDAPHPMIKEVIVKSETPPPAQHQMLPAETTQSVGPLSKSSSIRSSMNRPPISSYAEPHQAYSELAPAPQYTQLAPVLELSSQAYQQPATSYTNTPPTNQAYTDNSRPYSVNQASSNNHYASNDCSDYGSQSQLSNVYGNQSTPNAYTNYTDYPTQDPLYQTQDTSYSSQVHAALAESQQATFNASDAKQQAYFDQDDYGFGNKKLSAKRPDVPATDSTNDEQEEAKDKAAVPAAGWFGWMKKKDAKDAPIKANMGNKSSFEFDPALKKWVNKVGGVVVEDVKEPLAPPPCSTPITTAPVGAPMQNYRATNLRGVTKRMADTPGPTFVMPGIPNQEAHMGQEVKPPLTAPHQDSQISQIPLYSNHEHPPADNTYYQAPQPQPSPAMSQQGLSRQSSSTMMRRPSAEPSIAIRRSQTTIRQPSADPRAPQPSSTIQQPRPISMQSQQIQPPGGSQQPQRPLLASNPPSRSQSTNPEQRKLLSARPPSVNPEQRILLSARPPSRPPSTNPEQRSENPQLRNSASNQMLRPQSGMMGDRRSVIAGNSRPQTVAGPPRSNQLAVSQGQLGKRTSMNAVQNSGQQRDPRLMSQPQRPPMNQ